MKVLLLPVFFLLIFTSVTAQDSLVRRAGAQFSMHPDDLFAGGHFSLSRNRLEHRFIAQVGVRRTFFQTRMYPQLAYQPGFAFVNRRWIHAGVFARPSISMLHFNRSGSNGWVFYEEAFLGLFAGTGQTSQFRFSAGFGPCFEQSWSTVRNRYVFWFSWNFIAEISWSHAL